MHGRVVAEDGQAGHADRVGVTAAEGVEVGRALGVGRNAWNKHILAGSRSVASGQAHFVSNLYRPI